jgi:hypothetical protein
VLAEPFLSIRYFCHVETICKASDFEIIDEIQFEYHVKWVVFGELISWSTILLEKLTVTHLVNKFTSSCMETEGLLPYSREHTTGTFALQLLMLVQAQLIFFLNDYLLCI